MAEVSQGQALAVLKDAIGEDAPGQAVMEWIDEQVGGRLLSTWRTNPDLLPGTMVRVRPNGEVIAEVKPTGFQGVWTLDCPGMSSAGFNNPDEAMAVGDWHMARRDYVLMGGRTPMSEAMAAAVRDVDLRMAGAGRRT